MSITTLKDTSWCLNNIQTTLSSNWLIFISNGVTHNNISVGMTATGLSVKYDNIEVYNENNGWLNENDKFIDIAGGGDIENVTTINWFLSNAITIPPESDRNLYFANWIDIFNIAESIRAKGGTTEELTFPDEFISAIRNISQPKLIGIISAYKTSTGTNSFGLSRLDYSSQDFADYFTHNGSIDNEARLVCIADCTILFVGNVRNVSNTKRNQTFTLYKRSLDTTTELTLNEQSNPANSVIIDLRAGDTLYATLHNGYNVGTVYSSEIFFVK